MRRWFTHFFYDRWKAIRVRLISELASLEESCEASFSRNFSDELSPLDADLSGLSSSSSDYRLLIADLLLESY